MKDFFVSFSSADKAWAEWIAWQLLEAGYSGKPASRVPAPLAPAHAALTQTIGGLGGVGKTQLALEYVYRHAGEYQVIWWVRAEDAATLARDLPPVATATEAAEALGVEPEATSRLLNDAGLQLLDRGVLDRAQDHLNRALAIDEAVYGSEHPEVARDRNNLAGILEKQGHLAAAEAEYRRALKIAEAMLGAEHPNTRIIAKNLASVC